MSTIKRFHLHIGDPTKDTMLTFCGENVKPRFPNVEAVKFNRPDFPERVYVVTTPLPREGSFALTYCETCERLAKEHEAEMGMRITHAMEELGLKPKPGVKCRQCNVIHEHRN